jgi:hypothetical protein
MARAPLFGKNLWNWPWNFLNWKNLWNWPWILMWGARHPLFPQLLDLPLLSILTRVQPIKTKHSSVVIFKCKHISCIMDVCIRDTLCNGCALLTYRNDLGDEYHFLMECASVKVLRERYRPLYYTRKPSRLKFVELVNSKKKHVQIKLSKLIFYGIKEYNR